MKEKKGLSRYRKQLVFLMDLFLANIVYFVMIYWVPIRNGTTIQQVIDWMPNFGLMLLCLCTGTLRLDQVERASDFLIEIMPVMFVPAAVGLTESWEQLRGVLVPVLVIMVLTTVLVMVVTGHVTQFVMKWREKHD